MELSDYGKIVEKYICSINKTYTHIEIDKYCIMPNHIHFLVIILGSDSGKPRTPSPTNAIIPMVVSTLKRFTNKEIGFSLWQRSYHDHIIRDEQEYLMIYKYIGENPLKWEKDCFYAQ